jgi:hypothetical protein
MAIYLVYATLVPFESASMHCIRSKSALDQSTPCTLTNENHRFQNVLAVTLKVYRIGQRFIL